MGKSFVSFGRKLTTTSCAFVLGVVLMLAGKTSQAAVPQFVRHTIDITVCATTSSSIDLGHFLAFSDADGVSDTMTFTVQSDPSSAVTPPLGNGTLTLGGGAVYRRPGSATPSNLATGAGIYSFGANNYGNVSFTIQVQDLAANTDQVVVNVHIITTPTAIITTPYIQVHQSQPVQFAGANSSSALVGGATVTGSWSVSPGSNITVSTSGVVTGNVIGIGDTLIYSLNNGTCPSGQYKRGIEVVSGTATSLTLAGPAASAINVKTSYGDTVVLSGSGFNTTANNYVVYFGGAKGTVTDVTPAQIKVVAPKGATYGALQVIDLSSQLVTVVPNSFIPHHDSTGFIKNYTASQLFSGSVSSYSLPGGTGGPYSIEFADLDGDGDNEMIISGTMSDSVFVFNNNRTYGTVGTSSFGAPAVFRVAASPISLKFADFDGDGKLDIATVAAGAAQVSILRNTTTTTNTPDFANRFDVALPGVIPSELAIADFNKDGRPDIAVSMTGASDTNFYSAGFTPTTSQKQGRFVVVQNNYNKAPGEFMVSADFTAINEFSYDTTTAPISVAAGDLNRDGFADVVISIHNKQRVDVYRNTSTVGGSITFGSSVAVSTAAGGSGRAASDTASPHNGPGYDYTLYRTGYPEQVRIGDLDNDGKPDLAIAVTDSDLLNTNRYNVVALVRNTSASGGALTFSYNPAIDTLNTIAAAPAALALGDVDGDGQLDIVASNSGGVSVSIFTHKNTSGLVFNPAFRKVLDPGLFNSTPVCPAIGDIDGNSIPDIAVASRADKKVYFFRNYPVPDTTAAAGDSAICVGGTGRVYTSRRPIYSTGDWTITTHGNVTISGRHSDTVGTTVIDTVILHGAVTGPDTLSYTVTSLGDVNTITKFPVRTLAVSTPGTISIVGGGDSICVGFNKTFVTTGTGGTWSSVDTIATIVGGVAGTGIAHGVAPGIDTIKYSIAGCPAVARFPVRIISAPTAAPVRNNLGASSSAICQTTNDTLHITGGTHGGNWTSRLGLATVVASATHDSVYVTGVTAGTDTIIYKVTTDCGVDSSRYVITINAGGAAPSFATGPRDSTCNTTDLPLTVTSGSSTGVWSSSNLSIATVIGSGTSVTIHPVPGASGFTVVSYATSGCYLGTATDTIYVSPNVQNPVTLSGATKLCNGTDTTLAPSVTPLASGIAYSWSSSNASIVSVNSNGRIHGASLGIATISYSQSNACAPTPYVVTYTDTVDTAPTAGSVTGVPASLCVGDVQTASNTTAVLGTYGYMTWSSSAPAVASVSSAAGTTATVTGVSGSVTPVTVTATIHGCSVINPTATTTVTVNAVLGSATITAPSSQVCTGATISLSGSPAGGSWASRNTSVATVTGAGVVGGSATPGTVSIVYSVSGSGGCGIAKDSVAINVLPLPTAGTVTGSMGGAYDSLCASSLPVLFGNSGTIIPATGGSWSSFNTSVATVDAVSGVVSITLPSTADTTTIRFTTDITYACGVAQAGRVLKVKAMPRAGTLSTPAAICYPATALVTITNTVAHPAATGLGIWGTASIGTDDAVASVNIVGATAAQFAASATTAAGVDPYHTIHVYFVDTNFCGRDSTSTVIAVKTVPVVGISSTSSLTNLGADTMCKAGSPLGHTSLVQFGLPGFSAGGALTYAWSASNNVVLTLSGTSAANTTLIGGSAAGVDTITYSVTNSCGTGTAIRQIKVIAPKDGGTIVAPDVFCTPLIVQLYDTAATGDTARNGTWDVPVGTQIFIGNAGTNFGEASAFTSDPTPEIIRFTPLPNYCGALAAVKSVTVSSSPDAGTISGDTTVCVNATTVLNDVPGSGFLWFSSDTIIARVDLGGAVTGRTAGFTQINYVAAVAGCGTDTSSYNMQVKPLAPVGFIFGQDTSCVNGSVQLYDTVSIVAGGVWSSSNTAIASINATTGLVTAGLTGGQATITYATSNSCGSNDTTFTFRVFDIPRLTSTTTPPQTCDSAHFTYTATADTAGTKFAWTRATVTNLLPLTAQDTVAGISEYLDNTGNAVLVASYVYTLTAHGCVNNATVNVNVVPTPRLTTPLFDTICSGQTFVYSDTESTGPTTTATWTRAVVANITPNTAGSGSHGISEQLTSSDPTNAITVTYVYTLGYLGCPSHTENVLVQVDPVGGTPKITTHSPDALCSGTMYQNFGAETTPPANVTYRWSSSNAQVWATGGTQQYSLVNFTEAGNAVVYLKASASGFGNCFSYDSFAVTVSPNVSDNPEVYYFNGDFVCLSNIQDTYQWGYDSRSTLDSALFVGETNQAFNVPTPDFTNKYYFVMTTHNGCSQKSYFIVPTGVQNVTASMGEMSLYPNPASNMLNVEINNTPGGKYKVEVVDLLGHKINTSDVVNNRTTLDVADLAAGMYMVNCYRDGVKFASAKFVKN